MNRNGRECVKGGESLPWQRGSMSAPEKGPCDVAPRLCSRGPGSLSSPAMASELRMGERQMWPPTREPSDFWVLLASAYCTKEPEKTARGPKDVWSWNDQQVLLVNGPGTVHRWEWMLLPAPPAPPGLICSTALSSDPCQAMGVTAA